MTDNDQRYTLTDATAWLNRNGLTIHRSTLTRYVKLGRIPARRIGQRHFIAESDLEVWLQGRSVHADD